MIDVNATSLPLAYSSPMDARLLARCDRPVPRYTSYPTAPHFTGAVRAERYADWLSTLPPDMAASLYLHIPFCDSLCWFCGCHIGW